MGAKASEQKEGAGRDSEGCAKQGGIARCQGLWSGAGVDVWCHVKVDAQTHLRT